MKTKLFLLTSLISVFFINTVKGQIVVDADVEDVSIKSTLVSTGGVSWNLARIGHSLQECFVIPFQLPTIPVGESITDVKLSFNITSYTSHASSTNADLYGLGYRNSASVSLSGDYYTGANDATDAVKIQTDILTPASGTGLIETNTSNLLTYIDDQYTAGAVAGDFVFLRLNTSSLAATYNYYVLASADGNVTTRPTLTITTALVGPVAPVLTTVGNITIEENEVQNIMVNTTDANGDALTITASNVPSFVSFLDNGDGTATITLNPVVGDEGVYSNIIIQVSDGTLTDSETISITVTKLNTLIEIIATGATGYVSDPAIVIDGEPYQPPGSPPPPPVVTRNPEILDEMKIGASDVVGEPNLTSAILPFQLPARPSGTTIQDIELSVFVSFGREWCNSKVDLYGLPYQNASTLFSADYYSGTFGDNQNGRGAIGLEEDILVKTNPFSLLDTQRWVSTTNSSDIAAYIDAQYDAGAVAGDWIFFRFTVNNVTSQTYHYFVIDGGDGQGFNVDGTYNNSPKPSILKLDFYNPIDKTTTWDGATWSNGEPDNIKIATITGDLTILGAESVQAKQLTINNNATVTVNKGGNFVVHNSLTVDTGSKVLVESGGSFITSDDAATITINGDFWVERDSRATLSNYTYWSSPVNTTVQAALLNSGSPIVYRFDAPTHNDANNDGQDDGFAAWIPVTGAMNPGQGYAAYGSDDGATASIQSATFKAGEGSGATKEINNGVVNITTYLSDHTADPNVDDWNLLGNPYATSILGMPFMNQNPTVGTLYFWTHTYPISGNFYSVNDYASYNLSGGVDGPQGVEGGVVPDGKIASGQGFFTDVTVAGTVSFNASMQIDNVYDDYNNNFYRRTNTSNNETEPNPFIEDRFWVNIYNDAIFNQILIAFAEEATNNFDHQYDGEKLDLGNELMFYSIENDRNLVIQGKPLFEGDEVIPLGYKSKINTATTFKIELPFIEGTFKEDTPIYLVDKYLNITHDLKQGFYEFEISEVGVVNNRFEIVFQNSEALNVEDLDLANDFVLYPNPIESSFELRYNNHEIKQINLFNIQGKLIKEIEILENDIYNIQDLSTGIYFLKIAIDGNHTITKKVIKL